MHTFYQKLMYAPFSLPPPNVNVSLAVGIVARYVDTRSLKVHPREAYCSSDINTLSAKAFLPQACRHAGLFFFLHTTSH